jgi:hypothetical protein
MTEEQYQDLVERLERIEAHQQAKSPWGANFAMAMGLACLIFAMDEAGYAFIWLAIYFFVKAYRWTIQSIPPESQELMLMQVGEDGEPDRPTRLSSLSEERDTKSS